MKIDSIKSYPAGLTKQKHGNSLEYSGQTYAGLCENNNSANIRYYNGSFTGNGAAGVFSKLNLFERILKLCDKHTVIAQNLVALILASTLRPLAIMSLPGDKNREDKMYASGHAIASGLIGFGFSTIVMYPLGQAAKKAKETAKNPQFLIQDAANGAKSIPEKLKRIYGVNSLEELAHSKAFKNVTKILDMAPDVFLFGILKAVLTIKLIKPILKYCFGLEKKSTQPKEDAYSNIKNDIITKPNMDKFAGGIK